jgi:2-polyprenyl-3-methyl-5-hydroxy-6-metoxy-1,4-benzoquinol methylase
VTLESLKSLDARIPHWHQAELVERPCPLCDKSREPLVLRPDGLPLSYCGECHLWFVARIIPEEALTQFYSDYWDSFRPAQRGRPAAKRMLGAARNAGAHDIRLQRLEALLGGLQGRRIFEVGCGLGSFLLAAQTRGAEVVGQDISSQACDFVGKQLGLPIWQEPFECCANRIGPVDAVVMIDLVEHLARPGEAFETAWEMLPEGGLLLLWTPNGGAAGASLATARSWIGFRVDLDHLQYLSPSTIACLEKRGGWRIEHLETLGFPDLDGITKGPRPSISRTRLAAEYYLSRIPGSHQVIGGFRAFGRELRVAGPEDARTGTYHLFAIMRKA